MSTMIQEYGRGCGRSMVIQLIAVAIVVPLACVLIFIPLGFVGRGGQSIWFLIIPAGLFLFILFGGGLAFVAVVMYRRIRQLDALFTPLGLTGSLYQMFFRQYHGTVEGRDVGVYFRRGPLLEMEVSTHLQTRLGVARQEGDTLFLSRLLNREPMSLTDRALEGLAAFPHDEDWARMLFARPEVPDLLQRLLAFDGPFVRRNVILQPGWFRLQLFGNRNLFRFRMPQEQAQQWFDDLLNLVRIAEGLPAPQVAAEESSAERLARSVRGRNPYLTPVITIVAMLALFGCILVISVATVLLLTAQ